MTRFVLVRHGQTAWNEGRGERLRGRSDIDLDETGVRQAGAAAARLAHWQVDAVYSSPLARALRTARILAEPKGLPVEPVDGLADIDYGRWQGLSLEEAAADDRLLYDLWLKSPQLVTFPHGESLARVRSRALDAVVRLSPGHDGQTVVLVSHKVVCKVLVCSLLGLEESGFWRVQQDLCAFDVFEADENGLTVVRLNDACHLEGLE